MRGLNESNYKYQTSSVAGNPWANENQSRCAALYARFGPMSTRFCAILSPAARDLHARASVLGVDVVALDHAIQGLAID